MANEVTADKKAQKLLDKFVKSVGDLLNDVTALEVNTMVVQEITGAKFNAWEAYQEIYSINDKNYFKGTNISKSLQERYHSLFDKLEREMFYILINSSSGLHNPNHECVERYEKRIKWVKEHKKRIVVVEADPDYVNELADPILPNPTEAKNWAEIEKFLENNQFLRSLRKIIELKAALDSNDPTSNEIDVIYAQTVMQLDGDIINRYHTKLFDRDDIKELVLKTHEGAVVSGEQQWRELLIFMVDLIKSAATTRKLF